MKIIKPSATIISPTPIEGDAVLFFLECCGRVCYKSESLIRSDSDEKFIRRIIERGHESVLEHVSFSARFIVDRGVSHEIVRHRIASYSQESTRYCNYSRDQFNSEITVIEPSYLAHGTSAYNVWLAACEDAERAYFDLLEIGLLPQEARAVLPNSLKTELVMSANIREWRHFFRLRTSAAAHPQMREAATMLLRDARARFPVVFDDIQPEGGAEA